MNTVDKILKERGDTHGSYEDIVRARARMLRTLINTYRNTHDDEYPQSYLIVMWNDMLLKLVRSAANPNHQDNWDDLAGYGKIIQEVMEAKNARGE